MSKKARLGRDSVHHHSHVRERTHAIAIGPAANGAGNHSTSQSMIVAAAAAAALPDRPASAQAPRRFRLATNAMFAFDGIELQRTASVLVEHLASRFKGTRCERIKVVDHTNRLGSDVLQPAVSEWRAYVRSALVTQGISGVRVVSSGRGETQPVVQCSQSAHSQRVACLARTGASTSRWKPLPTRRDESFRCHRALLD